MVGEKDMYEFKSSKELLAYIASCKEQIIVLEKRLSVLSNESILDKDILRKKFDIKDKIRRLKKSVNHCYKYMARATCIIDELLMKTIYEYLTTIYSDKYVMDDNFVITRHLNVSQPWLIVCFQYIIITTEENYNKMVYAKKTKGDYLDDDAIIERCLEPCIDKKYVCLYREDKYPLLVNGELEESFKSFPCLKNLAYRLIDLDLARPEMSEEEKCNFICSIIKKRKNEKQKMPK